MRKSIKIRKPPDPVDLTPDKIFPQAWIGRKKIMSSGRALWVQRNPARWQQVLGAVALAADEEVEAAIRRASRAQSSWGKTPLGIRTRLLSAWADNLEKKKPELARTMAVEIGKPVTLGGEEVLFAVRLLRATVALLSRGKLDRLPSRQGISILRRPSGVIGVITPWNNPVSIPVGKIGAALAFGNTVVWKAAPHAPRTSWLVLEALSEQGTLPGLVSLVFGSRDTGSKIISHPLIRAITFTGSDEAGREVASLAALKMKPAQLELGGNNASLVTPDFATETAAQELAVSAFSFAGQRCTAPRRIIVHKRAYKLFREALLAFVRSLRLGDPADPQIQVGPVISKRKQLELKGIVRKAQREGANLLLGGRVPRAWESGCFFEPTVFEAEKNDLSLVQEETFGPVVVLQSAPDLTTALTLLNGVKQGLAASLYSHDKESQRCFLEKAECGILKLNQPTLGAAPDAPFGGWKSSGLGPPEHSWGDCEFYTRIQTIYRPPDRRTA
jgi:acyl-CoA reductase-like NAD-dependent aldehyde dehydrogenase